MRLLFLGVIVALSAAATAALAQDRVELYRDPGTGRVSSEKSPGDVALGTYVPADALAAQQAAMARQLSDMQTRLERLEAGEDSPRDNTAIVSEDVEPAELGPIALKTSHNKRKLRWESEDGRYSVGLQNRAQMRYSTPFDSSPRSLGDLNADSSSYSLKRIRTSLSGTVIDPSLSFHIEHDWNESVIRDFFLEFELNDNATLWVGRGKAMYNMEFWISSGRQQFIERTIAHGLFTTNRQQGAQLFGRLSRARRQT